MCKFYIRILSPFLRAHFYFSLQKILLCDHKERYKKWLAEFPKLDFPHVIQFQINFIHDCVVFHRFCETDRVIDNNTS